MAEYFSLIGTTREEQYTSLLPQIQALVGNENNLIAVLSNTAAALKQQFGYFWVGFYIVEAEHLMLGPFQGTVACMRIAKGKGVCGTAWEKANSQLVPDVDAFPGHIACSNASKSEVVIPIMKENKVVAVLDVDSDKLADFNSTDLIYLEKLCNWLSSYF
jgi:L-methionine (R)-S-oxide reductase